MDSSQAADLLLYVTLCFAIINKLMYFIRYTDFKEGSALWCPVNGFREDLFAWLISLLHASRIHNALLYCLNLFIGKRSQLVDLFNTKFEALFFYIIWGKLIIVIYLKMFLLSPLNVSMFTLIVLLITNHWK